MSNEIVGRLHLTSNRKYGFNQRNVQYFLFTSFDVNNKNKYLVATKIKRKYKEDVFITVHPVIQDKKQFEKYEKAHLNRILGEVSLFNNQLEMLFYKYRFSTKKFKTCETKDTIENRIDLREHYTISIDPSGSKDIDDALSIVDNKLYVHIADPTSYVSMNNLERFSTIYNKHRVINMYNDEIGYNKCSLIEKKDRNALTFIFDFNKREIIDDFPSIINVDDNLSYDSDNGYIRTIVKIMDLDITKLEDSLHTLIEKLMISVNVYTGNVLKNLGVGIFRNYEIQKCEDIPKLENKELHDFLKIIKSNCAHYSLNAESHDFLKLDNYCHFTSPLRRYADSINHLLWKKFKIKSIIDVPEICDELITNINLFESKTRKLSRDINRYQIMDNIGDSIIKKWGYIIGFEEFKIIVYFQEYKLVITIDLIEKSLSTLYKIDKTDNHVVVTDLENKIKKKYKLYDKLLFNLFNKRDKLFVKIN